MFVGPGVYRQSIFLSRVKHQGYIVLEFNCRGSHLVTTVSTHQLQSFINPAKRIKCD